MASTSTVPTAMQQALESRTTTEVWLLVLIAAVCLLPFSGKPFNIDDPLFIWTAQHIVSHPLDFYGFEANWFGWSCSMAKMMQNPPLFSYYLAAVGSVFGFSEPAMHLALLLPNIGVVVGTYFVARYFTSQPLWAALLTLFTPAVLVSSMTVMCDMMMLCFWMWSIAAWLAAMKSNRASLFLVSGLLIAGSALTKYFGVCLIPLLLACTVLKRYRSFAWLLGIVVPVVILALYNWATSDLYGRALGMNALDYVRHSTNSGALVTNGSHAIVFLGGCCFTFLFFSARLWARPWLVAAVAVELLVLAATAIVGLPEGIFASLQQSHSIVAALHLSLFCLAAINVLALAALDLQRRRDALSALLLLWVLGTVFFAGFCNWIVAGRTLLPAVPAAAILVTRRLQDRGTKWLSAPWADSAWRLAPAALLSFAVLWGDYSFAKSLRAAAQRLAERYLPESEPLWFEGHMGLQWYLEQAGAVAVNQLGSELRPGELVIVPTNNTCIFMLPENNWKHRERADLRSSSWVSTFQLSLGADFYAAYAGVPLPFIISRIPPEYYDIWEITSPLKLSAPEGAAHPLETGGRIRP